MSPIGAFGLSMVVLHVVKPPVPSQFDATALSDPELPVVSVCFQAS